MIRKPIWAINWSLNLEETGASVTARANAYVDFAVEVAKKLDLFVSEDDLQETINFWKYYQRVQ